MYIFLIISGAVLTFALLILLLVLFLTAPGRHPGIKKYRGAKFAHRGLHGEGRAENSLSAFSAAVEQGFGIELDVRLTKDGEVVVFHDDTLGRVTGDPRRVDECTLTELRALRLSGTEETIPTFHEVLSLVGGRVPLLVEVKEDPGCRAVSDAAAKILSEYKGEFITESFNPMTVRRMRRALPGSASGYLCDHFTANPGYRTARYLLIEHFLLNFIARPAFIAFDRAAVPYAPFSFMRRFWRAPAFAWTVRSPEEEAACRTDFDGIIFENYLPERDMCQPDGESEENI